MATYGAIVATGVAIYQFVRDRPGVKVKVIPLVLLKKRPDKAPAEFWSVTVVNHRKRGITIRAAGLLVDGATRSYPTLIDPDRNEVPQPFPAKLDDGAIIELYAERPGDSKVSGAFARDALGREYTVRYPKRRPTAQFRAWRYRRAFEKRKREQAA